MPTTSRALMVMLIATSFVNLPYPLIKKSNHHENVQSPVFCPRITTMVCLEKLPGTKTNKLN